VADWKRKRSWSLLNQLLNNAGAGAREWVNKKRERKELREMEDVG
jgi:uncharacterized protein YjiS (DUF1127 family)